MGRAQHILATGDLNPVSYAYPGLMIHLNALALGVFAWVGRLLGFYDSLFDFLLDVAVTRPGLHYVICRAVSVAMGVGTVVATFFLAREGYRSQVVGLVAALALATNYLHVRDSHFATVDIGMTFFVALSLVFAIKASSNHRWKNYLLAGLFAGAAAAAKYNAGLVILAPVAAGASGMLRGRNGIVPRLLVALVVMVAAFALLSPYSLIYYPAALDELAGVRRYVYGEGGARALWVHLKVTFPEGYGWPFFIAAVAGIVRAVWLRRPADLTLLAFLVPFFLLVASVDTVFSSLCAAPDANLVGSCRRARGLVLGGPEKIACRRGDGGARGPGTLEVGSGRSVACPGRHSPDGISLGCGELATACFDPGLSRLWRTGDQFRSKTPARLRPARDSLFSRSHPRKRGHLPRDTRAPFSVELPHPAPSSSVVPGRAG